MFCLLAFGFVAILKPSNCESFHLVVLPGGFSLSFSGGLKMRKLSSLCRKLRRIGVYACVVAHSRGNYRVHFGSGDRLSDYRDFSSVRECEWFLLYLFR